MVWPEMSVASSPLDHPSLRDRISAIPRANKVYCIVPFSDARLDMNRLAVFDPRGEIVGVTSKLKPAWVVGEQAVGARDWTVHGTDMGVLGACICYDAYFPAIPSRLAAAGASVLVVPALSVCPEGAMRYAPLIAVMRAVENRVPVVWAEPMASSLIVDSRGHIVSCAGEGQQVAVATVRANPRASLYARTGGVIPAILAAVAAIAGAAIAIRRAVAQDRNRPGKADPESPGPARQEAMK